MNYNEFKETAKTKIETYFNVIIEMNRLIDEEPDAIEKISLSATKHELEKEYIGTILIAGNYVLSHDMPALSVNEFSDNRHRLILDACYKVYEQLKEPVDIVSVSLYLEDTGRLSEVGGRKYINDLAILATENINRPRLLCGY